MKRRGKRNDGSESRTCRICGEVGPRVYYEGGYARRPCITRRHGAKEGAKYHAPGVEYAECR